MSLSSPTQWLFDLKEGRIPDDGIVPVATFRDMEPPLPPIQYRVMEKAQHYGATYVLFEEAGATGTKTPTAFIYHEQADGHLADFGITLKRLWSWGGVPLVYRITRLSVDLFRCVPDENEKTSPEPFRRLMVVAGAMGEGFDKPWWDYSRLRSGTIWDDPSACSGLLPSNTSAAHRLQKAVKELKAKLSQLSRLPDAIQRRLLVLTLLIAYLEDRKIIDESFIEKAAPGCTRYFETFQSAETLLLLLQHLQVKFNGDVFSLSQEDQEAIRSNPEALREFKSKVEGHTEEGGQRTLWRLYSFGDIPVEVISYVYQIFVKDNSIEVYTPPFLARLLVEEVLDEARLDRILAGNEVILDPACGSGIFLVEAFKRLILHWRHRNNWKLPTKQVLHRLLEKIHGIDISDAPPAVELAAFSLCLAMCDELDADTIRSTDHLFPRLRGVTLQGGDPERKEGDFFERVKHKTLPANVGVIIGNPPFNSDLKTDAAQEVSRKYGTIPDNNLAYLFLLAGMDALAEGGVACLLQPAGFLYNGRAAKQRRKFFKQWKVQEILNFVSIRGLFSAADKQVIAVLAESSSPEPEHKVLHATFRRTHRVNTEVGFDLDYYDTHWVPQHSDVGRVEVWKANLLGVSNGVSLVDFFDRSGMFVPLKTYVEEKGWDYGEGFKGGVGYDITQAAHLHGKPELITKRFVGETISSDDIKVCIDTSFSGIRHEGRFTSPRILMKEHQELILSYKESGYLTYRNSVVGIGTTPNNQTELFAFYKYLIENRSVINAYLALVSPRSAIQKATVILKADIDCIPVKKSEGICFPLCIHQICEDINKVLLELVRLGEDSDAMKLSPTDDDLSGFGTVFCDSINQIHKTFRPLKPEVVGGVICFPFVLGDREATWENATELGTKIDGILEHQSGNALYLTRIARIFDGPYVFLIKPNKLRYWLRTVAMRDAEDIIALLWEQGY